MTDWDEVKRLAADFQKVQLGSTTQRLSERNCIEIITWLKDRKFIDLIFTVDGKECLTSEQLIKDIENELYDHNGRINLVDLAKNINVDLSYVNSHVNAVLKANKGLQLIVGQLIDSNYVDKIVSEINEKLAQQGQINVNDLTIQYDLPGDFLQQVLEKNLDKLPSGRQDPNDSKTFFTESFIERSVAKIRGALFALTKPVTVTIITNHVNISEKLFYALFDKVGARGSLTNRSVGAQFIPHIYTKSQNEWIHSFFAQNNYLEYDALKKIGVTDIKSFIKKHFPTTDVITLDSCLISNIILERTLDEIEDCIASRTYTNLSSILPSVFNAEDVSILMSHILTRQKNQQIIVLEDFVLSLSFIDMLMEKCKSLVDDKAKTCVDSGRYQEHKLKLVVHAQPKQKVDEIEDDTDKRKERRKKASGGKSGGGTQGRETKTKSVKKIKTNLKHVDTEVIDADTKETLELISKSHVIHCIQNDVSEAGLNDIQDSILDYILPKLNDQALQVAEKLFVTTVADRTASLRQTHNELQQKLNDLIGDIRLFEKGIKLLPTDLQNHLYKYILKTLCTEVTNEILNYIAQETNNSSPTFNNNEQRLKFLNELPPDLRTTLTPTVKSLTSPNTDDFMASIDQSLGACSMILKKIDKKRDRTVVLHHKQGLLEQLNKSDDLPLILHLAVMVIFITATQCMLHASGRHLHQILLFLKQYLSNEEYADLITYHDYVGLMLSGGTEEENVRQKLLEMVPVVRNIGNNYKKPVVEKS